MQERAVQQTDAADEAGASDGASPLICVLGGPKLVRIVIVVAWVMTLGAPDMVAGSGSARDSRDEDAILEAIVRKVVADLPLAVRRDTVCLRVTKKGIAEDPSDRLLRRFADASNIRKASSCKPKGPNQTLLTIWPIQRAGTDRVETKARACWGDVCGPIAPYQGTLTGGRWVVSMGGSEE
jgi:hypothetical protein